MRKYELTYIVHPSLDQEELGETIEGVQDAIEAVGGIVHQSRLQGLRRLAYPIQKVWEGYYIFLVIEIDPQHISELERRLKLTEQIIRHLIVRMEGE